MRPSIISSSSMKWAVGGWSAFIAENFILSENRTWLIEQYGDDMYHYMYGILSTAACTSIGYGYLYKVRNKGPYAWALKSPVPPTAKALSFAFLSVGFGIASQTLPKLQLPFYYNNDNIPPKTEGADGKSSDSSTVTSGWKVQCPFDFTDAKSYIHTSSDSTRNVIELNCVDRISRHPGLWSFGIVGLGFGILNPCLPTRVWMSMPLMVALIGGSHTDSRYRRGMGGKLPKEYDEVTSNIPFLAMMSGRQGNVVESMSQCVKDLKPLNAMLGVGAAALIVANRGRTNRAAAVSLIRSGKSSIQGS